MFPQYSWVVAQCTMHNAHAQADESDQVKISRIPWGRLVACLHCIKTLSDMLLLDCSDVDDVARKSV